MSEYTPITTDLRLLVGCFTTKLTDFERDKFSQLCDVLDSIHAALEAENERLREQDHDGWIELPKDADGEYIHIGDVMDFSKNVRNLTVLGIGMVDESECNWGVFVREGRDYVWYNAKFLRHHAPTVEDVLKEMHGKLYEADRKFLSGKVTTRKYSDELAQTIDEYAAKLRLAGDAE